MESRFRLYENEQHVRVVDRFFALIDSLKMKPIDPSLYINRFASQMEFGDQLSAVCLTALRITKRMQRDWIVLGRRPLGIVAAALLLAARIHGFRRAR